MKFKILQSACEIIMNKLTKNIFDVFVKFPSSYETRLVVYYPHKLNTLFKELSFKKCRYHYVAYEAVLLNNRLNGLVSRAVVSRCGRSRAQSPRGQHAIKIYYFVKFPRFGSDYDIGCTKNKNCKKY